MPQINNVPGYIYPPSAVSSLPPALVPDPQQQESAYPWRGFLLDSARTMWPVETILELLEILARYRFNKLHWHLTDNCGWRFAVPGYPKLVEIGAQLPRMAFEEYTNVPETLLWRYQEKAKYQNNSGYYTDTDIKLIVERAAALDIEIMPEVDLPGHVEAATIAYPELGNPVFMDDDFTYLPGWPKVEGKTLRNNLLWPNEKAYEFMRAALSKVCELFPSTLVHIGGDECDYEFWEADRHIWANLKAQGLENGQQLQAHFMAKAKEILRGFGRSAAVWDEVVDTSLDGDETVFGWRENIGVEKAAGSGNPWIFADANYLYLNRLVSNDPDEQVGMLPVLTLDDVLTAPLPSSDTLKGVQASAWCEFITSREQLHYQLFPRLLAAAELAYCGQKIDVEAARSRIAAECETLKNRGFGHAFMKQL